MNEVALVVNNLKVIMEAIGEGNSGDYNPDDPDDKELLRFSCYQKDEYGEWNEIDDASYCTQLPVTISIKLCAYVLGIIMEELENSFERGSGLRKSMESMSWLSPKDFKGV